MISGSSDSRLVGQTLRGRRESFNRLVERHVGGVYAVAMARTRNHADAEDIVQDAFIRAYTGLDKLRDPASFGGWVTTIARNAATKLIAKRSKESDAVHAHTLEEPSTTPDPSRAELQALLRTKLDTLDDDAREILLLHYFVGESARAIAERLEISRDAALKRLERARGKLAKVVLHDLEASVRDREPDLRKMTRRIVGAIAAVSVPWRAQTAAAASWSPAKVVGGVAVVLAIAGTVVLWPRDENMAVDEPVATPPADVITVAEVPSTDVVEPTPVDRVESVPESSPRSSVREVADVVEIPLPTLDGLWTLHQPKEGTDGPGRSDWPAAATVELVQDGDEVTMVEISTVDDVPREVVGTFEDGVLTFPLYGLLAIMWDFKPSAIEMGAANTLSGGADPGAQRVRLAGMLSASLGEVPPDPFHVVMNRLQQDRQEFERFLNALLLDTRRIRDAIVAYAYDHRGRLPSSLSLLVPRYLDDRAAIAENEQRVIEYNADARDVIGAATSAAEFEQFAPGLPDRDRVIQWERDRVALFGDAYMEATDLLRVRIGNSPIEIRAAFRGDPEVVGERRALLGQAERVSDSSDQTRIESGACMEQLKTLGLAIAQFWELTDERYMPAGWRSLVPDFIESPSALTCPAHAPGTVSYELVFPAMSLADLAEIVGRVQGVDPATLEKHILFERIPMAYESAPHDIDGRAYRVALFLDGHVELFDDAGWAEYVEPYLRSPVR